MVATSKCKKCLYLLFLSKSNIQTPFHKILARGNEGNNGNKITKLQQAIVLLAMAFKLRALLRY